ncbi:MAG: homoserine dehydrogenase, partial [Limisphaerales bacterium]
MQHINIGIIGGGTVGGGVYQALQRNGNLIASRLGAQINVAKVAVRDLKKARNVAIPANLLTTDWRSIVNDPNIQVIAELMGGTTIAKEVVLAALKRGKAVVTANKALLSAHGEEL